MDENFTRISNDILEALSRTYLTQYEWRLLMCLFRKTYGHQKKEDWIAPSQIVLMTGIHKAHVSRSLGLLIKRNIVTKRGNQIGFNKYHTQWEELPNGATNHRLPNGVTSVTKRGTIVTKRGISELPNGADTKETITKETIQKKDIPTEYGNANVNEILKVMEQCFGNLDSTKAKNRQYAWLLYKKSGENLGACVSLVRAASQHDWWKSRITKVETLYKNANMITKALKEQVSTSYTPQI